jgi:hypothetical protein
LEDSLGAAGLTLKEEAGFGKHRLAGQERRLDLAKSLGAPGMITIAAAEECD